jgi:DedD protein
MRLPFFRSKDPADGPARPGRGKAAGAAALADEGPVQAARTRARRRLIGALVLLAVGVVGFPVLFETQPRPLPLNTPILLPEGTPARVAGGAVSAVTEPAASAPAAPRNLPVPPPDAGSESPALTGPASAPAVAPTVASVAAGTEPVSVKKAASAPQTAPALGAPPAASAPAKVQPIRPDPVRPEGAKTEPARAEGAKPARAASEPATAGRFVVQVGAYNDVERLRAARQKVEKLGYKTYTQEVESPSGKRTRVRLGPFVTRDEAEAAAGKVKAAGLQANILAL